MGFHRFKNSLRQAGLTVAGLGLVLLVWEVAVHAIGMQHFILPAPSRVFQTLFERSDYLAFHAGITALEILLGLIFGVLLGMGSALLLASSERLRGLAIPALIVTQALPVFAIAPLLVLWFGYGLASKVLMAVLIIYFPVVSSFLDALIRTDAALIDLSRIYGASRFQKLMIIRFPAALPALASGLRLAATAAPIGAIVGEWVGSSGGLGFIMLQSNARLQTDLTFAALFVLAAMAVLLRFAVDQAMTRLLHWMPDTSRASPTTS